MIFFNYFTATIKTGPKKSAGSDGAIQCYDEPNQLMISIVNVSHDQQECQHANSCPALIYLFTDVFIYLPACWPKQDCNHK